MKTKPMNVLYIFSDEHNKEMLGCYGHPIVQTPNLDRLAASGVRFTNAYCNSPVCVPSRASMATGRYVHDIGNWDNAMPYTGAHESWGHRLLEQGHEVTTIGKLHYRQSDDDSGFPDQRIPMHVYEGLGDIYSLIRDNLEPRPINREKIMEAGPGETSYTRYDRGITHEAIRFLQDHQEARDKPWALFLGYVSPHFPLIAPEQYYNMYPLSQVELPKQYRLDERPKHPVLEAYRKIWAMDDEFDEMILRKAVASYYGLCSFLDDQIGQVLQALNETGLMDNTLVIYSSDHGDTLGNHGVWFKSTMYEGAVAVPFIVAGPSIPKGIVTNVPISLVDSFPTIIEAVGAKLSDKDADLPGKSILPIAMQQDTEERVMFSEYHAMGSITGTYMIRYKAYKYIHYVGYAPQLFNLEEDPDELQDLASDEGYAAIVQLCEQELRKIVDLEAIHEKALADQAKLIDKHGGRAAILSEGFKIPYSPVPQQFIHISHNEV